MKHLSLTIFFIFSTSILCAQPSVQLKAHADSTSYIIGDCVELKIEANTKAAIDSIAPILTDSVGSFEVLHIDQNLKKMRWTIYLSTTDSGRVFLPPIPFRYYIHGDTSAHFAIADPLFLNFRGLSINPQGEIKDLKPPHNAPIKFADLLPYLIAILLIGLAIGGWCYYKKKKKRKEEHNIPVIIIPPHKEALAALRKLEEKRLWQQGLVKEYYSEVTEILRTFFAKRWEIPALEFTTDEILTSLKHIPDALRVWNSLEWCLRTADLVKFAKFVPNPEDNEREIKCAYEIVQAMSPKEQQKTQQVPEAVHAG